MAEAAALPVAASAASAAVAAAAIERVGARARRGGVGYYDIRFTSWCLLLGECDDDMHAKRERAGREGGGAILDCHKTTSGYRATMPAKYERAAAREGTDRRRVERRATKHDKNTIRTYVRTMPAGFSGPGLIMTCHVRARL